MQASVDDPVTVWVLEGPDFAGKSTVASLLSTELVRRASPNRLVPRIVHVGQPGRNESLFDAYLELVAEAVTSTSFHNQDVIFDRLHVGELIYGPLYRHVSMLDMDEIVSIDRDLDACGAVKVHVDASDAVLLERFRGTRGDDLVTGEADLLAIANKYRDRLAEPFGDFQLRPWFRWDSRSNIAELAEQAA